MVRISDVWDRTMEVLSGRGRTLAGIAAAAIFLPGVVRAADLLYVGKDTPGTKILGAIIAIAASLLAIWAQLTLIALSTDPATTPAHAGAVGRSRLLPAIGIGLIIGIVVGLAALPFVVALIGGGWTPAMMATGQMPALSAGTGAFVALYGIAFLAVFLFLAARMMMWTAVLANERLGLGTIGRSFALTRGITWKLIGVILLYLIVLGIAFKAVSSVTGVIFGLILGTDAAATVNFIAMVAGGVVSTGFSTIAAVFTAQLYVATRASSEAPSGL